LRGIVYDWAEDEKVPNPLAGLRLFAKGDAGRARRKIKPPERDEIDVLVTHARREARDAILVAAATGLRRGELFGLRWRDVDFTANEIHVTAYNFAGRVEDGRFKTDAAERDVPLFKSIRQLLLERKARRRFSDDDEFIFGTAIGTAMDPNNFVRRELKAAIKAANKSRAEKELAPIPAFRWHDFRHYAVSVLIKQRADILTLARIAGHSDPNVTLKVYGHLMDGAISEAADLYDPLAEASSR
jgi:integrase